MDNMEKYVLTPSGWKNTSFPNAHSVPNPNLISLEVTFTGEDPIKPFAETEGGPVEISVLQIWQAADETVMINGVSRATGHMLNGAPGGISPFALDELCMRWLDQRGLR